jgi:hypothetical protein
VANEFFSQGLKLERIDMKRLAGYDSWKPEEDSGG